MRIKRITSGHKSRYDNDKNDIIDILSREIDAQIIESKIISVNVVIDENVNDIWGEAYVSVKD